MRRTFAALTLVLLCAACAAAVVPDAPVALLTGKDQTEYTLNEYDLNEKTGRVTVVIAGNYPPGSARQKAIAMLTSKHHVPVARARKVSANLFCFRFAPDGARFQRVFDRYVDADGAVLAEVRVDTNKWETAKPQLTSGAAYRTAIELLSQQNDVPEPKTPPAPDTPPVVNRPPVPPQAQRDEPRPAAQAGRAVTAAEWQKLSYAQLSKVVGKNTDVNEFIPYVSPDGSELEGYVLAAVAARKDADTAKIMHLLLDRGADPANDPVVLANYILTHGKAPDMRLVERLIVHRELLDTAFFACCTAGAPQLAEKLLDAGASVNEAEYSPDSTVLLEALNVKAAPEIIRLLVARGADTKREGEVYDAKSGETFRGNAAQLAEARGYGADVLGLLK